MMARRNIGCYYRVAMKIPSRRKMRFFVQVTVACLITLSANLPVEASDLNSESGSVGEVACKVSETDKAFGIQVISDVACAAGGLGCYNDHCRYCKVIDTLKSAHLESCESLGASFPTMAPLTLSTGTCLVSSGDAAVGVGGMTDPSCLYGGIGCFSDHCRFCQSKLSPLSSSFLLCSWVNHSVESLNGIANPSEDLAMDLPAAVNSAVARGDVCSLKASYGNVAVGIDITSDATCASGGVGCINNICRFCKAKDTTQSAHLNACPVVSNGCSTRVSDDDAAVGINIVTDTSCAQGGIGCIDNVCRFCRTTSSSQSVAYADCTSISNATTQIPASSAAPVAPAPAPTTTAMQVCSHTTSDGDAAVGIKIVTDTSCFWGGLGCIDQICRFCRVTTTIQSGPFVDCATIGSTMATPAVGTTAPIKSPIPATLAPTKAPVLTTSALTRSPALTNSASTKAPAPSTAAPTKTPAASIAAFAKTVAPTIAAPTDTPVLATVAPTKAPARVSVAPTSTPTSTISPSLPAAVCNLTAAAGDVAVGINIVTDISCVFGGVGCIDSVCRFCRLAASTQSAAYVDCAVITKSFSTPTPIPTRAATPTLPTQIPPTKTTATPSVVFVCSRLASSGDKGAGLDIVSDVRCSEGGIGCLDEVCRFCKRFDTVQSQSYLDCSTVPSADIGADITFVQIRFDNNNTTMESERVTESRGDRSKKRTVKSNFNSKKRAGFKLKSEDTSKPESAFVNTMISLYESGAVKSEMDFACANVSLADGQAAGGIGVVLDTTNCPRGLDTGCVGSEGCRYCMRFPTSISKSLDYCAMVNSTAVAYALSGLSPFFDEEGSVLSADEGSAGSRSGVTSAINAKATALNSELPKSVLTGTHQWFAVAAACVGAILLVALGAFSHYRTNSSDPELDTSSPKDKRVSFDKEVVVMSNLSDPGEIADV